MRLLIDMQAAQGSSRKRGIGRYARDLTAALIRLYPQGAVHLLLNGLLAEGAIEIRRCFRDLIPWRNFHVWRGVGRIAGIRKPAAADIALSAEIYQERVANLAPEIFLVPSVFEGWHDDALIEAGKLKGRTLLAAVVYDFIPLQENLAGFTPEERAWYKRRLEVLGDFDLALAISRHTDGEFRKLYGEIPSGVIMAGANPLFRPSADAPEAPALQSVQQAGDKPYILCVGALDERKNHRGLLEAYRLLPDYLRASFRLVIPHTGVERKRAAALAEFAAKLHLDPDETLFLEDVDDDSLARLYRGCSLFVHASFTEGFGLPVLEAMRSGAPVICSGAASLPEIAPCPEACFDPHDPASISAKMREALADERFREGLVEAGRAKSAAFSWEASAREAKRLLEAACAAQGAAAAPGDADASLIALRRAWLEQGRGAPATVLAKSLARTFNDGRPPQLFADISILSKIDSGTGIQRVVRSIGAALPRLAPAPWRVRFVRADFEAGCYVYADEASRRLFGFGDALDDGAPLDIGPQDVFLGLDLALLEISLLKGWFCDARAAGLRVYCLLYDLIPVLMPQTNPDTAKVFEKWLKTIAFFDGVICISKNVAETFRNWLSENGMSEKARPAISWFHLGCDLEKSLPTRGMPGESGEILQKLEGAPLFLMVGSIEPRKGHAQALAAFERLWDEGHPVNLVIVDRNTWRMEDFLARLASSPWLNKRLFRLENISDEYLEALYKKASALVFASEMEGFGLPIIEAARRGLPLILRDLPVFREVAGENAFYFSGREPDDLAEAIKRWLALGSSQNPAPNSAKIKCLTWEESCRMLLSRLPLD